MSDRFSEYAWSRAIGAGWDAPYKARNPCNLDDGPWQGMPLGGFGGGCIGRSPRGDFNLWHLDGMGHVVRSLPACQFSIFEETAGRRQAYALCTQPPEDGTLSSWQWYPPRNGKDTTGTYRVLYPRSTYDYEGVFAAKLHCEQFSPIWAGNYQESSYPVAIFEWVATNPTDEPITLSILLTWENTVGWFTNAKTPRVSVREDGSPVYEYAAKWGDSIGNFNRLVEDFHRVGCVMSRLSASEEVREGEGQWAIATVLSPAVEVFYQTRWNPVGDGADVWQFFARDGSLQDLEDDRPAREGERLATALAARCTIRPGKTRRIPFILAWDFPAVAFGAGDWYYRRYTDFFGRNGKNAWSIVRTALKHGDTWRDRVREWQKPVLDRPDLPASVKMALFNELYMLASGGTFWTAADNDYPKGRFSSLESWDYRWYESLDVRLYGSLALLMLWPDLEKSILLAFARAIPQADPDRREIGYNRTFAPRKLAGATPHDLGAPNEQPWTQTNYTSYQDCNLWKDLPCDFVLQVYRDYLLTGATDTDFLRECWSAVVQTLAYLKTFDRDGDGIPENSDAPDQTYDDWEMRGISAYCGGLWLAALEAAIAIGEKLADTYPDLDPNPEEAIATYQTWLTQAKPLYQENLWNGQYYRVDSGSSDEIVMADQLCGQFYAQLLHLPDIVPRDRTLSVLQTVYQACFVNFNQQNVPGDPIGAANGVRLDGSPVDPNATHPLEVWIGINFGLAAFFLQMGMKTEAFELTEAVIRCIYEGGMQFRTPEAITAARTFRACYYLRPLAIWGIYGVLADFRPAS